MPSREPLRRRVVFKRGEPIIENHGPRCACGECTVIEPGADFELDREWARRFDPHWRVIAARVAVRVYKVRDATVHEDRKLGTDLVLTVDGVRVACRVRRMERPSTDGRRIDFFADVTLRSWRASGAKTEIDKLGTIDLACYGWTRGPALVYWLAWNVPAARDAGVLDRLREIRNPDGHSGFVVVRRADLLAAGCIVAHGTETRLFDEDAA